MHIETLLFLKCKYPWEGDSLREAVAESVGVGGGRPGKQWEVGVAGSVVGGPGCIHAL